MLFSIFKTKNLKKEIEVLEERKNLLLKENSKSEKEKHLLEIQINDVLKQKNDLDAKIKNRENFFIEHELILIDTLSGLEFEEYFAKVLTKLGYNTQVTKASGDDGGDIIATKDNIKYVFQCKNYSDTVGNKAVQEVYSAKGIYKCDKAIVITNNYFTKQAKKESDILSVELWDRNILLKLLCEAFEFDIKNIDKKIYLNSNNTIDTSDDTEDPLLSEAIESVIEIGEVSTSFIQRRFKIGYARSGRIIDQMEKRGIISGYEGSKPRKVLISKEKWKELNVNSNNSI